MWGDFRFAVLADAQAPDGLKVIDLGAGHSSSGETLCGRVLGALKAEALLNESVGAGYIDRNWPPALTAEGAWPLASLRQSFLNGSLTRLLDPDTTLRGKIVEFVARGDFGLASGRRPDGTYERVWFQEAVPADEVAFEPGVFLLTKAKGQALKAGTPVPPPGPQPQERPPLPFSGESPESDAGPTPTPRAQTTTLRLVGAVPAELWNRLGTRLLPKLRAGTDLRVGVDITVTVDHGLAKSVSADLRQILEDLGLAGTVQLTERSPDR